MAALLFAWAFLPSLDNGFVGDDWVFLSSAADLSTSGELLAVFEFREDWFYRPIQFLVTTALFRAEGLDVFGYRLLMLLLHAGNGLLFGGLVHLMFRRVGSNVGALPLAIMAALLFLFSARQHEAVFWFAAVTEPLGMSFRLLGLYGVWGAIEGMERRWWIACVAAALAYFGALVTKEPGLAFAGEAALVVALALLLSKQRRETLVRGIALGSALAVVALHWIVGYVAVAPSLKRSDLVPLDAPWTDWVLRFLQAFFRLLPLSPTIRNTTALLVGGGLLLALVFWAIRRREWLVPFALAWSLVLLAPYVASTWSQDQAQGTPILLRAAGIVEDRYMYYPGAGFALFCVAILGLIAKELQERDHGRWVGRLGFGALAGTLALAVWGAGEIRRHEKDWDRAGAIATEILDLLTGLGAPPPGGQICLANLPENYDNFRGHYVLRNALPSALFLHHQRHDFGVFLPPLSEQSLASCNVWIDVTMARTDPTRALLRPEKPLRPASRPRLFDRLDECLAQTKPITQVEDQQQTLFYIHLFRSQIRPPVSAWRDFLGQFAEVQQLDRPDDVLLFFRLWVADHRSGVLISDDMEAAFLENQKVPGFDQKVLRLADQLGLRREVEGLLGETWILPPRLRLGGGFSILLPGPYAACATSADPAKTGS